MRKKDDRLLWLMLLGIAAFNKADFFLTLDALEMGFREINPLLIPLMDTVFFPLVKLLVVPLLLLIIWSLREQLGKRLLKYVSVPFVAYFLLMVYFQNIMSF